MVAVTAAMVTAVMVATGTLITVVTVMAATEVVVTAMVAMDMVVITVIGMATGTGMVATGTDAVTVIGGMVAGGHMVSVPVGDWCAEAGSGFAIDRNADRQRQPGTPDPICGLIEAGRISSAIYRHQPPRLTEARFEREPGFLLQRMTAVLTRKLFFGIDSVRLCWKGAIEEAFPMPGDPKECRQHALTCARLAQTSASPHAREQFANLAQTWLRRASDLERTLALIDGSEDEPERLPGLGRSAAVKELVI